MYPNFSKNFSYNFFVPFFLVLHLEMQNPREKKCRCLKLNIGQIKMNKKI